MTPPDRPGDPDRRVRQSTWRDEPAIEICSAAGRLMFSTLRGGKIVSLRDQGGHEWLAQPAAGTDLPPPAQPGAVFTDADMCGWDECAPTIVGCEVDEVELPDHGELWTSRWWHRGGEAGVLASSFSYRFSRRIEPTTDGFALHYKVSTAGRSFPFLWAAHPQFLAPPGSAVVVDTGDRVWDVLADPAVEVPWNPGMAHIDTVAAGGYRKFNLLPERPVSTARLRLANGRSLRLAWDERELPYLGVWFDAQCYARDNVVALEPSTGFFDSLERAVRLNRVPVVRRGNPLTWTLRLSLGPITT